MIQKLLLLKSFKNYINLIFTLVDEIVKDLEVENQINQLTGDNEGINIAEVKKAIELAQIGVKLCYCNTDGCNKEGGKRSFVNRPAPRRTINEIQPDNRVQNEGKYNLNLILFILFIIQ